jgi:integrase
MINYNNYLDVKDFLNFQKDLKQNDPHTVSGYWYRLVHLMKWADEISLTKAGAIRPAFPAYLEKLKTNKDSLLSSSGFTAICKTGRAFFLWAKAEFPGRYRSIDNNWILSIRPPRARREESELHTRLLYTVEEAIKLATFPVTFLSEHRTQAAVALLFLSGMRIGAFMSLPINCVDLEHMRIFQLPERGVMTKNRKAAITTLLNISELLKVVRTWDIFVREKLDENLCWYPHMDSYSGFLPEDSINREALANRRIDFCDSLRNLCNMAGVEYRSAHKFRNGHAVYALKHCQTMSQFKSVSQNLMHSTIGITDGVYGNLVRDDVHDTILGLSNNDEKPTTDPKLQAMFEEMIRKYAKGKE